MITISLCMIVRNEENNLAKCLSSVADLVDEIIIVDTGSVDNTVDIAEEYTNNIYFYNWNYNFSDARNFSFSKATKEYIFWLDADDVMLEEDRNKFKELKQKLNPDIGFVAMKYNYIIDESGTPILTYYRERLVKRDRNPTWYEPVHEYISTTEPVYKTDICITHTKKTKNTDRNLNIYKKYMQKGNKLSSRGMLYYAMELQSNNLLQEAVLYYENYLKNKTNWNDDSEWASLQLGICYQKLEQYENAIKVLVHCLEKCIPKAEIYCEIGNAFIKLSDYDKAIFWFELALAIKKPEKEVNYRLNLYEGFIPNYQLSICYYALGDIENAIFYNEEALKIKPNDENALKNKILFEKFK